MKYDQGHMPEPLHTVQQVADQLKLHPKTVLRLIHEGRLKGARIGKSYRILDSDLRAFANIAAQAPPAVRARVTCVAEIEDVTIEQSQRIASVLNAPFTAYNPERDPVHLTTAYDPATSRLKAVLIASPADAAGWLQMLQVQLENLR
jgi:excisionase family DNA binding protein